MVRFAGMPARRTLLKRITLWTAAAVLVLASYILGAPLVWFGTWRYAPELIPVVNVLYAPFNFYCSHPELPGSRSVSDYYAWCYNEARKRTR